MRAIKYLLILLALLSPSVARAVDSLPYGKIPVLSNSTGLGVLPGSKIVYSISKTGRSVSLLNIENLTLIKEVKTNGVPVGLAVNLSDNHVFVTIRGEGGKGLLSEISPDATVLRTIDLPRDPQGIATDEKSGIIAIAIEKGMKLHLLNISDLSLAGEIPLPYKPRLISVDKNSGMAVIIAAEARGEGAQKKVLIVDIATGEIKKEITLNNEAGDIAVSQDGGTAFITTQHAVFSLDMRSYQLTEIITADKSPKYSSVAFNPLNNTAVFSTMKELMIFYPDEGITAVYSFGDQPYPFRPVAVEPHTNKAIVGGDGAIFVIQLPNPVPNITNIIPSTRNIGEPDFTLKVEGEKFITSSLVTFDKTGVTTTFKNDAEVEALVPTGLLIKSGSVDVTVTNPEPEGGTSAPYSFKIKNPLPVITSLSPSLVSAQGSYLTLAVYGTYLMADHVVYFNGEALQTEYVSASELQAIVPSSLIQTQGTYLVVVMTQDNESSNFVSFTVTDPYPSISDFTPKEGPTGTVLIINGNSFQNEPTKAFVGDKQAIVLNISQNTMKAVVPAGAVTGHIKVETSVGSTISTEEFTVKGSAFELVASPPSVLIPSGGKATFVVGITSTGDEPFGELVSLSVPQLPDGVTINFNPAYISEKTGAVLTVNISPLITSQTVLNVMGTASSEGKEVASSTPVTIDPIPAGITTISGRVVTSKDEKPIKGVTLKLGELSAITDDAGNFFFTDVPSGEQVLIIDGHTANTENATYPSAIPVQVTIIGGIDNKLPYFIYLHQVNTEYFTPITTVSSEIKVTDPEIPDFEMTIPAGVQIIGWDGMPNEKVSVQIVPRDRLPIPPPPDDLPVQSVYMFYFGKPGGGTPTSPIPVKVPNTSGAEPGTKYDMYYYDEEPYPNPNSHQWKKFGTGMISDDGRQVVSDPGVGIPKFCCGAIVIVLVDVPAPSPNPDPGGSMRGGDPIDLATGIYVLNKTDVYLGGRIPISIERTYRTIDYKKGPFGIGASHNYDTRLLLSSTQQRMTYLLPDGGKYYFYKQSDGSFRNDDSEKLFGSKAYLNPNMTRTLRFRDGTVHRFDSSGMLTDIEDTNGNRVFIDRKAGGQITSVGDDTGRLLMFAYDEEGRVASIIDHDWRHVMYTYDSIGRLISVTDPEGGVTSYAYDAMNRMLSITDARGIRFLENEYDSENRVSLQTVADGGKYKFYYFSPSTPVRYDQPPKMPEETSGNWRPCSTIIVVREGEPVPPASCGVIYLNVPSSKALPTIQTQDGVEPDSTATYSVNQTVIKDPNGNGMTYRFNGQGYVISETDGLGGEISYERQPRTNRVLSMTDKMGRKTSFNYDSNGNIASVTDPAGNVTMYEYDSAFNKPIKITDAVGNVTVMTYDERGNLISLKDPTGNITTIAYTQYGQPASIVDEKGNVTTFEYDEYGNLITVIDPLGNKTKREHDILSRVTRMIDPKGISTYYVYDDLDRVTEIKDAVGSTKFAYDPNGNLTSVTDAKGQTITYTYDVMDRVSSMTDPLGRTETYEYDLNGNPIKHTDRKGQVAKTVYDYLNRPVEMRYADKTINYTYDASGRIMDITDSTGGLISRGYDVLDRLIRETTALGSLSYTYDAIRRTSMTVAGQPTVYYDYDANSRLTDLKSGVMDFGFAYDEMGRRTALTYPNGITTSYSYDNASNIVELAHATPEQIIEKLVYQYDPNGNRKSMDRLNVPVKLPNPASNITYNAANQMLTFTEESLSYDLNGNLVQKGATTYQWNARNQLIGITGPDMQAAFKYDALGRRIEKTINGKTTQYLYDGLDIVQEIENGMVSANYIRTLNIDEPLARIKADGTVRYYQQDALGSVVALTDESGAIKTQYVYDPFGNTSISGEESDQPFQYTGRENDGTGLYYYRARFKLDTRFISEDPIGLRGGVNRYLYVGDNPLLYTDPLGLVNWGMVGTGITTQLTGWGLFYGGFAVSAIGITEALHGYPLGLHALTPGITMTSVGGSMVYLGGRLIYEGFAELNTPSCQR